MRTLPKRERRVIKTVWGWLTELRVATEEKGPLIPFVMAGQLLGVSRQRAQQLAAAGRLQVVECGAHRLVSADSVIELAKMERRPGRPWKSEEKAA